MQYKEMNEYWEGTHVAHTRIATPAATPNKYLLILNNKNLGLVGLGPHEALLSLIDEVGKHGVAISCPVLEHVYKHGPMSSLSLSLSLPLPLCSSPLGTLGRNFINLQPDSSDEPRVL